MYRNVVLGLCTEMPPDVVLELHSTRNALALGSLAQIDCIVIKTLTPGKIVFCLSKSHKMSSRRSVIWTK